MADTEDPSLVFVKSLSPRALHALAGLLAPYLGAEEHSVHVTWNPQRSIGEVLDSYRSHERLT